MGFCIVFNNWDSSTVLLMEDIVQNIIDPFFLNNVHCVLTELLSLFLFFSYCLAFLKQQRNLAFSSCVSVSTSSGASWERKCKPDPM